MKIRILLVLLPLLTTSCQAAGVVAGLSLLATVENQTSVDASAKDSATAPKTSSAKDSATISKKLASGAPKTIVTKVKEKLAEVKEKLLQQKPGQQVKKNSISELPPFWGYMNDEHRGLWNEGNPYLRQSLTKYYKAYGAHK